MSLAEVRRWDGTSWSIESGASTDVSDNELTSISVLDANNIFVSGINGDFSTKDLTFMEKGDGSSWSLLSPPSATGEILYQTVAYDYTHVFVVGKQDQTFGHQQTFISEYNGSGWNNVTTPNPGSGDNVLNCLALTDLNHIWVGGRQASGSDPDRTLIMFGQG